MNRYPLWKYILLLAVLVVGLLYALPNLYGEDPAVQIADGNGDAPGEAVRQQVLELLGERNIAVKADEVLDGRYLVRLRDESAQLRAVDEVAAALGREYVVAPNLAPDTPEWLRNLNARPMYLGLDLRGGVHFLMEVDVDAALRQASERYVNEFRNLMREERVRYQGVNLREQGLVLRFDRAPERNRALSVLREEHRDLQFEQQERDGAFWLIATLPEERQLEIAQFAVQQNITTLRNRVNELGVAEPVIQRQGPRHIVVQLPGVQDTARAKEILGATATLQFRAVDMNYLDYRGGGGISVPPGSEVLPQRGGGEVVLKRQVILTGESITDASAGFDPERGRPMVSVRLDSAGGTIMQRFTSENVKDYMAVLFIEPRVETVRTADGELVKRRTRVEEVINVAQIQDSFGSRFQITGLDSAREAQNLSLLLRAGSLAAPMEIVEERTIGPSLGQQNIDQGFTAVVVGFLLVVVFMAVYYKVFGLIANLALFVNLVLIIAVLSMLQATLTLPGIAGIVLTVGMAVDANVLIFERIREELRAGVSAQSAIQGGYGKAFSTIADANITTLIAAIVLFTFGTGPIKGFAVTLSIGILSSMLTAIMGTRAVVNALYGGRRVAKLPI
ncbi:protein translocase subunit SecD [Alkalilimnicola sp. S0819]|uniref:protein translocase subunit SecD n=1 Tax=Alkalilimnicola sp. S0819 TaxID=2613922 RepID=UPI001261C6E6|nr:protein translocase subunit SecD [Alkalilimnicola sp. S0819]KAB7628387.1 protein translocase subunit SecD [Alkalilimnicola sp. S0819]MPQ15290.1 protein translocase subunit SecD [Alkalilimnicola sp. S0819]